MAERNLFMEKVTAAGWDVAGWAELFETDLFDVRPEGRAEYTNEAAHLVLEYLAAEECVTLLVAARGAQEDMMKYRFYFDRGLENLLDSIIGWQGDLSTQNFTPLIKRVIPLCQAVFYELPQGQLLKLSS
ncbi:MAG TPA: hypothetical protein VJS44_10435 [Pyrinomonadaceae bacterium]|nr:hypothetical protein [Pyrinomonadaceae bacterium]